MSLSDLASLGSFVSGAAVLASLVFLYFQMRQMTEQVKQAEKNQQAIIQQGVVARSSDQFMRLTEPTVIAAYLKGQRAANDITEIEFGQYLFLIAAGVRGAQDTLFQYRLGLLDGASLENQLRSLRNLLSTRGGRAAWTLLRATYDADFYQHIDELMRDTPILSFGSTFDAWKAEAARLEVAQ